MIQSARQLAEDAWSEIQRELRASMSPGERALIQDISHRSGVEVIRRLVEAVRAEPCSCRCPDCSPHPHGTMGTEMSERKIINGELCEAVTGRDLRQMDIVYGICEWPGHGMHRGVLIRRYNGLIRQPDKSVIFVGCWILSPTPGQHPRGAGIPDNDPLVWHVINEAAEPKAEEMEMAREIRKQVKVKA